MKIYFAAAEKHNLINIREREEEKSNILLSYWDWIGPIPFRKISFKYIILSL